jgi:hypothetical protein
MLVPNAVIRSAYVWRGARLWAITRGLLALAVMATVRPRGDWRVIVSPMPAAVLLGLIVCFVDVHVRRERAFLENLGVAPAVLAALFIAPMLVGETVMGLVALIAS